MAKYTLSKNAVMVLRSILQVPGSCKTIEDIFRGGKMLAAILPVYQDVKEQTTGKETVEIELDGPERDLCKSSLQYALGKEMVPASAYLSEVISGLDFISAPK